MVPIYLAKSHQQAEQGKRVRRTDQHQEQQQQQHYHKPSCSYTCLIGMALKSSKRERMTVGEMYTFIRSVPNITAIVAIFFCTYRNRFPYYKTCASDTWKVKQKILNSYAFLNSFGYCRILYATVFPWAVTFVASVQAMEEWRWRRGWNGRWSQRGGRQWIERWSSTKITEGVAVTHPAAQKVMSRVRELIVARHLQRKSLKM